MTPLALEPRQPRQHRRARDAELARQVGRAGAGIGLQQGEQLAVEGVQRGMALIIVDTVSTNRRKFVDCFDEPCFLSSPTLPRLRRTPSSGRPHADRPARRRPHRPDHRPPARGQRRLRRHRGRPQRRGAGRAGGAGRCSTRAGRDRGRGGAAGGAARPGRRRQRPALPPGHAGGDAGARGRLPLLRPHRGRGRHARDQAAGRRRGHRLHAAVRSGAGFHRHRRAPSGTGLRQPAGGEDARRRAAGLPHQLAQVQPDLERRRPHQRVLPPLRGDPRRPQHRGAAARRDGALLARRHRIRGLQHLRRPGHAVRNARRPRARRWTTRACATPATAT